MIRLVKRFRWAFAVGLVAVLALSLAIGCSDDDDGPTVEEAQAAFCGDLESLGDALDALAAIGAGSTVGELRDARDDVKSAVDDVRSSAEDVKDAKTDELEGAYDDLDSAVRDISDDATISEALSSLEPAVQGVRSAWESVFSTAECLSGEETPPGDETPAATDDGSAMSDEDALQELMESTAAAWNAGDVDTFLAAFTDDGLMSSFEATREEAMQFLPDFIGDPPIDPGTLTNISVDGDAASADAEEFALGRIYDPNHFTFMRVDGAWLLDSEENLEVEIPEGTTVVDVNLLEYQFAYDAADITGGNVAFDASNVGAEEHELAIASLAPDLDLESALESVATGDFPDGFEIVGVADPLPPGTEKVVRFTDDLAPGRYALLCFLEAADGTPHAFLGMTSEFTIQ